MESVKFNCPICETDEFKKCDEVRHKPAGMIICTNCGFITYERAKDKEELHAYYEIQYRGSGPSSGHLSTAGRKLEFVKPYFEPIAAKWREKLEKDPKWRINVLDVGCGIGYLLNLMRILMTDKTGITKCEVMGTEWTESFRRVANHMFGIQSTQEIDMKKKYRMIISYHVLEHQIAPQEELKKYKEIVERDDHVLFISVPVWGDLLINWDGLPIRGSMTTPGTDYRYHPDHINVWRQPHWDYLMAKCGWEKTVGDDFVYGDTGIYRVNNNLKPNLEKMNWKAILDLIIREKEAIELNNAGKPLEAIKLVPKFPEAIMQIVMKLYNGKKDMQIGLLEKAVEDMPKCEKIHLLKGTIHQQYEEFDLAEKHYKLGLQCKPNSEDILYTVAQFEKIRGNYNDAAQVFQLINSINPARFAETMDGLMNCWGKMPTEKEQKVIKKIDTYAKKEIKKAVTEAKL